MNQTLTHTLGEHSTCSSSVELLDDLSDSSLESSEDEDSSEDLGEEMGDRGALELDADPMEDWWWPVGVPNVAPEPRDRPAFPPMVMLAWGSEGTSRGEDRCKINLHHAAKYYLQTSYSQLKLSTVFLGKEELIIPVSGYFW